MKNNKPAGVPDVEVANPAMQPILSFGTEVNCELIGMENYEDYIVCWYYNSNGALIETLMNEETAMQTANPIYIIDNAEEASTQQAATTQSQKSSVAQMLSPLTSTIWESREYQINYRYENWGKSEFFITAAHINEYAAGSWPLLSDGNTYCTGKKIAEVHKNDIGLLLIHTEQFNDSDVLPYSDNYTFFNTYERDWFNSPKGLGIGTGNGKTLQLNGNRKYRSEWYGFDPDLPLPRVDYGYIYSNWSKWYENTKGKFTIYRQS